MKPFEIKFDFPLAHSDLIVSLKARVELHHSDPYYVIDDFRFAGNRSENRGLSVLPRQEIKLIQRGSQKVWVHKESNRESRLSIAMGKAIEKLIG